MKKYVRMTVAVLSLAAILISPSRSLAAPQKIKTLQSNVTVYNSKLEKVQLENIDYINGEILETDNGFLKFVHKGNTYYIKVDDTLYNKELYNNTEYLQGEDVLIQSQNALINQVPQGEVLNYTSPLHFGRRGEAGEVTKNVINDFKTSGSLDNQLKDVIKTVVNLDIKYGGDNSVQGQVSGLDNGYTMCNGVTWLTTQLLDKTDIEYRYVITYPIVSENNDRITGAGHMYVEVKNANNNWMVFDSVEMLNYDNVSKNQSEKNAIINVVYRNVKSNISSPSQPVQGGVTPTSYNIKYSSVGITNSSISTPIAERQIIYNYK